MSSTSIWEQLDFMSVEAKLYIKGKDRYKTKFGFLMSILSFISICVLSCFFLKFYIEKVDVNVLFLKESKKEALYMDLNFKPFFFRLIDIDGKDVDPRLVSFTIRYFFFTQEGYSWKTLETEACKFEKHLPDAKYKEMFKNVQFESHTCIENDKYNLNITDDPINNIMYYFNLYVSECNNSTLNNNSCYPREIIKDYVSTSNIYFSYYFPDFKVDHYNTTSPLKETFTWIEKKIYHDMFYGYNENFKVVNYTSDEGTVMQDLKSWTLFGRDESSSVDIALKSTVTVPNTLSVFTLSLVSGKVDYYKRTYPKIQSVVANIGGVLKFIMTISSFLSQYISSQMLGIELSNNFIYDKDKEGNKSSKGMEVTSFNNLKSYRPSSTATIFNKNLPNRVTTPKNFYSNIAIFKKIKERKSLTFFEALMPKNCLNMSSAKHSLNNYSKIIKTYMSTDNILKLFKDFENIKYLYLNEKQVELFDYMRCPTLQEHYMNIEKIIQNKITTKDISNLLKEISNSEKVNNKMIEKIIENCDN
jgi:hypothetical protein